MSLNKHYMEKDGVIKAIPANEWAKYRADGWAFSNEKAFDEQKAAKRGPGPDDDGDDRPTMDNTKAEITAYLEANGYDVDQNDTKAELLAALDA